MTANGMHCRGTYLLTVQNAWDRRAPDMPVFEAAASSLTVLVETEKRAATIRHFSFHLCLMTNIATHRVAQWSVELCNKARSKAH
jgi:hypothetical protein